MKPSANRFVRVSSLAAFLVSLTLGCNRQPESTSAAREPVELSWRQQIVSVQQGTTDEIRIKHRDITDADLVALDEVQDQLRRLNLSRTEITDAGLARIARLTHLFQLRLAAPRVTDAGLAELSKLSELQHLHLIDVPVSDAGLAHLEALRQLKSLYLDHSHLTDAAGERLARALPNVHLHFDGGHVAGDTHGQDHTHD